jgi:hypothetical protein
MNCPIGAQDDGLGHVDTVYPADLGAGKGACVRGLTAARLLHAAERIFTGRKGHETKPVDEVLQDVILSGMRVSPSMVAVLADLTRPLEGALAAAALCEAGGVRFAAFVPPEDTALVKAGLTKCPPFPAIADCNLLLAIGDPFSTHPAVVTYVRDMQFGGRGNKLISLDTAWGRTSAGANESITVGPLKLAAFIAAVAVECGAARVAECLGGKGVDQICSAAGIPAGNVRRLAAQLKEAKSLGILLSHPVGRYAAGAAAAAAVGEMAQALKARVWPLLVSTNSAALPHLKQRFGAAELSDVLRDAEAGRLQAILVLGADLSAVLPEKLWRALADGRELTCWAGSLQSPFAEAVDAVVPLALPWEEEGTVLSPGGEPVRFVPWMPKPATVLTARELALRLFAYAGGGVLHVPGVAELMATPVPAPVLGDLIGPSVLNAAQPGAGQAVMVGAPEPQGYTGGLSLAEVSWQRRLAGEEKGKLSADLAAQLGLAEPGLVSLRNGMETTVLCAAAGGGEGRVVALPSHWRSLRELLQWRGADGAVEPAPALVSIEKA